MTPLIIGHRGASAFAPENTVAAIKMAIDAGADGVEFDVRLAQDGVPVVIHDPDLRRVAGRQAFVSDLTSAELGKTDVGSWFDRTFPGRSSESYSKETVPSLAQVLNLLRNSAVETYVELKFDRADRDELVKNCCDVIRTSGMLSNIIVKSFRLELIEKVKECLPDVRTAALFEPGVKTVFGRRAALIGAAARYGASQISLHWSLVNDRLIDAASSANMPVTIWTVDHPRWVTKSRQMGIRSLITNDPAKLLAKRNSGRSNLIRK